MYGAPHVPAPESRLRPIVSPNAPAWIIRIHEARPIDKRSAPVQFALVGAFVVLVVAVGIGVSWLGVAAPALASTLLGVLVTVGLVAGIWAGRAIATYVIAGPVWKYKGVTIKGAALSLLADIDSRFRYAQRMIGEVPTGIDWHEISGEVRALMWESASHAARVSALDTEISEMRYAARGTPQAAFKKSLEERRSEHWNMLKDTQLEADALASVAGNAAAAAKIALLRTGSLAALEVVTPTAQGLAARSALRDARARLELLAEVWAQLDESNAVLAEKTAADFERPRPALDKPKRRGRSARR